MQSYPGLNVATRRRADGSVRRYYYHRATGKRIDGEPGTPEFDRAYIAAERAAAAPAETRARTFGDLVEEFFASPEHKGTAPKTQRLREFYLKRAAAFFKEYLAADLSEREIRQEFFAFRDSMAATPAQADNAISALQRLVAWAYDRSIVRVNHASRIKRLVPPTSNRRDKVWTPEMEAQLLAGAHPSFRRLYLFALYSLAREGDLCRLRRGFIKDGWLSFTPAKTGHSSGVTVHLPTHELPPFKALLDECGEDHLLLTETGRRWTETNIRNRWRERMRDAGLGNLDRTFHDVRRTGISRLLDAGCTEAEAAAISGHLVGEGGFQAYAARSRALAINAYRKWTAAMTGGAEVLPFKVAK